MCFGVAAQPLSESTPTLEKTDEQKALNPDCLHELMCKMHRLSGSCPSTKRRFYKSGIGEMYLSLQSSLSFMCTVTNSANLQSYITTLTLHWSQMVCCRTSDILTTVSHPQHSQAQVWGSRPLSTLTAPKTGSQGSWAPLGPRLPPQRTGQRQEAAPTTIPLPFPSGISADD